MVKINNGDGKTRETAIIIMSAEDRGEGWNYMHNNYKNWKVDYSSVTELDGFETQYVVFSRNNEQVWFDWTWVYSFMR